MKHKVIFDTNSIRNAESASDFLGGRKELESFLKMAEIILPDIVIDEIKSQKRKHLVSKRDSFLSNPFHFLRKIDEEGTKNFDIETWISELVNNEKIPHTIIHLTRENALEEIRNLCLENCPPFDESTDRGFKDAYIYITVLDYLKTIGSERVFLVSKDGRLKQAFYGNTQVKVVANFEEFERNTGDYFRELYFIDKLKEELSEEIDPEYIQDIWLNINENWVIKVNTGLKVYFTEVDFSSREILNYTDEDFSKNIDGLKLSGSFGATHSHIAEVSDYDKYFSDQEIIDLVQAATENEQIYWIASDEDVKEFFNTIFQAKQQIIGDELRLSFMEKFK